MKKQKYFIIIKIFFSFEGSERLRGKVTCYILITCGVKTIKQPKDKDFGWAGGKNEYNYPERIRCEYRGRHEM
jgi:hypothetical protein